MLTLAYSAQLDITLTLQPKNVLLLRLLTKSQIVYTMEVLQLVYYVPKIISSVLMFVLKSLLWFPIVNSTQVKLNVLLVQIIITLMMMPLHVQNFQPLVFNIVNSLVLIVLLDMLKIKIYINWLITNGVLQHREIMSLNILDYTN